WSRYKPRCPPGLSQYHDAYTLSCLLVGIVLQKSSEFIFSLMEETHLGGRIRTAYAFSPQTAPACFCIGDPTRARIRTSPRLSFVDPPVPRHTPSHAVRRSLQGGHAANRQ